MHKIALKNQLLNGAAVIALAIGSAPIAAHADEVLDNVLRRLDKLERENAALRKKVEAKANVSKPVVPSVEAQKAAIAAAAASMPPPEPGKPAPKPSSPEIAAAAPPLASNDGWYFHKKDGPGLTFQTPGGEFGVYGQFDVSFDVTSKGLENKISNGGSLTQNTNAGWMPQIASNLSMVGFRGFQKIPDSDFRLVYQMETLIDVVVNSGSYDSVANQSTTVKGGLTTRDSFIGLADKTYGTVRVGKVETPYKKSTDVFNPFAGMLGDYRVIMGNTGGDNRVEFAARLEHSIWWESPDWNGLKIVGLYSPGQNRADNSDNIAAGASDCAGGNSPYSGGFTSCADGAFSDAFSVSATYSQPAFLITAAYERHQKVNRSSDLLGVYGNELAGGTGYLQTPYALALQAQDVGDEDAWKIGALYKFPSKTTVGFIYESMHRYLPADLQFQNERTRNGTWAFLTQDLTPKDQVSFGWAHAFKATGDPGQHTFANLVAPGPGFGGTFGSYAPNKNDANMLTAVLKHQFSPALTWYLNGAMTMNDTTGHYDLGAGGHGATTDCHDAFAGGPSAIYGPGAFVTGGGGVGSVPQCWTGATLLGVSTGFQYKF